MELINLTRYAAQRVIGMDGDGRETLVVAVKATFALAPRVITPALADEQPPVVLADEYGGEPAVSSIVQASEMMLAKPAADVLLRGCAYAKTAQGTETMVTLRVPPIQKTIRVTGDRAWTGAFGSLSRPAPLSAMPLVYERAYGGRDDSGDQPDAWPDNPVGVGFRSKRSRLPVAGGLLPNLEDPATPMSSPTDRPPTRGFGPIAPGWSPRPSYAGTYDAKWERDRMPLLPLDFNPRFHQVAPPDQILPGYVRGGELVTITSVRPGGEGFHFAVPTVRPSVVVRVGSERHTPAVHCDTLAVDAEAQRLSLVFRAAFPVAGRVPDLAWIKVEEGSGAS
jgi:hypothetical protein